MVKICSINKFHITIFSPFSRWGICLCSTISVRLIILSVQTTWICFSQLKFQPTFSLISIQPSRYLCSLNSWQLQLRLTHIKHSCLNRPRVRLVLVVFLLSKEQQHLIFISNRKMLLWTATAAVAISNESLLYYGFV